MVFSLVVILIDVFGVVLCVVLVEYFLDFDFVFVYFGMFYDN